MPSSMPISLLRAQFVAVDLLKLITSSVPSELSVKCSFHEYRTVSYIKLYSEWDQE